MTPEEVRATYMKDISDFNNSEIKYPEILYQKAARLGELSMADRAKQWFEQFLRAHGYDEEYSKRTVDKFYKKITEETV